METPSRYTVGLVQMAMSSDPSENLARAVARIEEAAGRGAQVICLPELFRTPYFCQREDATQFDLAEPVPGPTTEALAAVARRLGVAIIAPVFERRAAGVYHNSAAVIDADGRLAGVYRKMHIPDDPGYYEKYYFTPGDLGFTAVDTRFGRVSVLICWDQWFPEAARLASLRGPSIIFYPTAIGWHPAEKQTVGEALSTGSGQAQREAWRTVQRGHAIANGVFVAAVNRVGLERPDARVPLAACPPVCGSAGTGGQAASGTPTGASGTHTGAETAPGIEFWGSSFLCGPFGEVLAEAPTDREATLVAPVELSEIEKTRRAWPLLRDRRTDAYQDITRRLLDGPPAGP
jgi:N-carbamoylputrescine amidase